MRTVHVVRNRYNDGYDSPNVLRIYSRYTRSVVRLGIGYMGPEDSGRQTQGGALIPGPWAFTYPLASVIDCNGGTGREMRENEAANLEWDAKVGDHVMLDGREYEITESAARYVSTYPKLTLV